VSGLGAVVDDRAINYPAVLRQDHYQVLRSFLDYGNDDPYSGLLHTTRQAAETERRQAETLYESDPRGAGRFTFSIYRYTEVYELRCCTCGEHPDHRRLLAWEWDQVHDNLGWHPGWEATDELTIFCPTHRDSNR